MNRFTTALKNLTFSGPDGDGSTDWLLKILGLSGDVLPDIRKRVEVMRSQLAEQDPDRSEEKLSFYVSSRLIKQSAMKTATVGGVTAAPAIIPVIGTIGTALAATVTDFAYLTRRQIELCYEISAVYDTEIDEEELRAITLALIGFSGTGEMIKGIAAGTLINIVDAAKAKYLKAGLVEATAEVAARISPRFLGRAYKLIPLLGIPLSASINIASTMMVGNHARKYFSMRSISQQPAESQAAGKPV
ncbi:MAG: hypothetical protein V3S89_11610 [Desulfobacterales bacterium]